MRTKETIMVPKEVTTVSCDFCSKSVKDQICYSGHCSIMLCHKCNKDGCGDHIKCYNEMGQDYCDYHICVDCQPKMEDVWFIAHFLYVEDEHCFVDLVDKIWDEFEEYQFILKKLQC